MRIQGMIEGKDIREKMRERNRRNACYYKKRYKNYNSNKEKNVKRVYLQTNKIIIVHKMKGLLLTLKGNEREIYIKNNNNIRIWSIQCQDMKQKY